MYKKRQNVDVVRASSSFVSNPFSNHFKTVKAKVSGRKAQVTIFIILGILLLLALVLVIFFKKEVIVFKPEEIIPTDKGKIESDLIGCIEKVGGDGLFLIGLQGGYIQVPEDIMKDGNARLQVSPMHAIPYWANGPDTFIPSLEEIKFRIDKYIEENLRSCLLQSGSFQESYDLIEKSAIISNTEIVESKVIFNVHWDIEIRNKAGDVITEVIDHVAESPAKLKKVYTLAKRIVEKEMGDLKLEDITQDLISLEHHDVPVAGMEISCAKKSWNVQKVKESLLELVRVNIKELKIKDTNFVQFPEELPYYQNHYIWDLGEEVNYPQINVNFNFDQSYPYVFGVTPTSGSRMFTTQLGGTDILSFLCIQNWKFTYDFIYPIKVRVRDETSGYDFNIALMVHLIKNQPNRKQATARPSISINTVTDEDYCGVRNVPMTVKTYELVENDMGVSNREELEGVNLSFTCLKFKCDIGQTESDFAGLGFAGVNTNFPYCSGGILRGLKEGYKENWVRLATVPEREVSFDLVPLLKYPVNKIKIIKHELDSVGEIKAEKELGKDEVALIELSYSVLENSSESNAEGGNNTLAVSRLIHKTEVAKTKDMEKEVEEQSYLEFLAKADFNYKVDIKVMNKDKFVGGYVGNWSVVWNDLEQANEIVFHVVSKENMNDEEMTEMYLGLNQNSKLISSPEIK